MVIKRALVFITWFCLSHSAYAGWGAPASAPSGIKAIQEQTGFTEHTYERVSGPTESCFSDEMELKYEQTGDNVVLHLGERFIFADIGHPGYTDNSEPGCSLTVTNTLKKGQITQTSINNCKNPVQSFSSVQSIKDLNGRLVYTVQRHTGSKLKARAQFTCVFKVVTP